MATNYKKLFNATCIAIGLILSCNISSFADIYKYTDANGNKGFTNDLKSLSPQLRKNAKLVAKEDTAPEGAVQIEAISEDRHEESEKIAAPSQIEDTKVLSDNVSPYKILIIPSFLIVGFITAGFFVRNRRGLIILKVATGACVVLTLVYMASVAFGERFKTVKKDANEAVEMLKQKDTKRLEMVQEQVINELPETNSTPAKLE